MAVLPGRISCRQLEIQDGITFEIPVRFRYRDVQFKPKSAKDCTKKRAQGQLNSYRNNDWMKKSIDIIVFAINVGVTLMWSVK